MSIREKEFRIVILGGQSQSGSYLLRLRVHENLRLPFGRFKKGKVISVPAGEYIYVGSALAKKGGVSLGRRLVRHATRTGAKQPHKIRSYMLNFFKTIGLGAGDLLPKNGKHLFWNVDHLLDHELVDLVSAIVIRSEKRLERELGQLLESEACIHIFEKGLGANDVPGNTHILRVEADERWWLSLPDKLECFLI
jgi:Uri superfamily endonuclease